MGVLSAHIHINLCLHTKETNVGTKEIYLDTKETYLHTKETNVKNLCGSPLLAHESLVTHERNHCTRK